MALNLGETTSDWKLESVTDIGYNRERQGINWLMPWLAEMKELFNGECCAHYSNFRQLSLSVSKDETRFPFTIIGHILKLPYRLEKKLFFPNNTEMI